MLRQRFIKTPSPHLCVHDPSTLQTMQLRHATSLPPARESKASQAGLCDGAGEQPASLHRSPSDLSWHLGMKPAILLSWQPHLVQREQRSKAGTQGQTARTRGKSRKGKPGASYTASLQRPPHFHLFISNRSASTSKFPSDSQRWCRHVGFNVTPSGSVSLVKIPLGWSDTQLLSRAFPFFQPKEAKPCCSSVSDLREQPRGAGKGPVITHRVPLLHTLSHSGFHSPRT